MAICYNRVQRPARRFCYAAILPQILALIVPRLLAFYKMLIYFRVYHEYQDILFFFKCKLGCINICIDNYIVFCTVSLHRGASGIFLNNVYAKTSLFRDLFYVKISNLWNALPSDLKSESNVNVFKNKLKTFYFTRLHVVFDATFTL